MIASLRGRLLERAGGNCVIEAGGVGYFVQVSTTTARALPEEGSEVFPELLVCSVVISAHGGFLKGAVHAFDLAVGPGVVGLGKPVLDAMLATDLVEAVDAVARGPAIAVPRQVGELDAVVGEDRVQVVGDRFDQCFQERDGGWSIGLRVELSEGELRVRSIAT